MAQRGRVPEFGKWDGSDVAYTKVFDVARKDKGTAPKIINPNDPQQNPEAFRPAAVAKEQHRPPPSMDQHQPRDKAHRSTDTSSARQRPRETSKRPAEVIGGAHPRGPAIPKFGAWNESNPTASPGYTMIFNEVKEKRHAPAPQVPTEPSPDQTRGRLGRESNHDVNGSIWAKMSSCFKPSSVRE